MKLLLDQNLSPKLENLLRETGVDCAQVRSLKLENASDISIWQHAKSNGYTIVTSDSDFSDIAIVKSIPPRIILLRYKNTSTKGHLAKLTHHIEQIEAFVKSPDLTERVFIIR